MTLLWRLVLMIVCMVNPLGTLKLMNFLRSLVSGLTNAVAKSTRKGILRRVVTKERMLEMEKEKESEERGGV